jgi:hypothetical protein
MKLVKLTNGTFEEEKALVEMISSNMAIIIAKGDIYHDKIDEHISGILVGLDYANVEYDIELKEIHPIEDLFRWVEFDDQGDYDDED